MATQHNNTQRLHQNISQALLSHLICMYLDAIFFLASLVLTEVQAFEVLVTIRCGHISTRWMSTHPPCHHFAVSTAAKELFAITVRVNNSCMFVLLE